MLTDFLIRAVRDAFFHHLHRTIAGAHIRHSPSTRFVYACVCVYVYVYVITDMVQEMSLLDQFYDRLKW